MVICHEVDNISDSLFKLIILMAKNHTLITFQNILFSTRSDSLNILKYPQKYNTYM